MREMTISGGNGNVIMSCIFEGGGVLKLIYGGRRSFN